MEEIYRALVLGVSDYFRKNNFGMAVIGLSGGIDSSVSACIASRALGRKNLVAILMPDAGVTPAQSLADAVKLSGYLGINYRIIPINDFANFFIGTGKKFQSRKLRSAFNYSLANAKARTRMTILYYFANLENALVIGTSDKSEIALGYTTKFGDGASDISVIGDLWKSDVIMLAKFLKVPASIINKKPSAELVVGMTAEEELGAPYEVLDKILKMHIEKDLPAEKIIGNGFDEKIVNDVIKRIRVNEHKRRSPVVIRVSERSFHNSEWRMPITNGYS